MSESSNQPVTLPEKIVVTLLAGGVFFAAANVICVFILAWVYLSVRLEPKALAVTGSARKAIVSDLVTWSGTVSAKDPNLVTAYDTLKIGSDKVKDYLLANGIPEAEITLSAHHRPPLPATNRPWCCFNPPVHQHQRQPSSPPIRSRCSRSPNQSSSAPRT